MSEKNVKMILSSSILVPDQKLLRWVNHFNESWRFSRTLPNDPIVQCEYANDISEVFDAYKIGDHRMKLYASNYAYSTSQNRVNKHMQLQVIVFEFTDTSINIYRIHNKPIYHMKLIDRIPISEFIEPYVYIGTRYSMNSYQTYIKEFSDVCYCWGISESDVYHKLKEFDSVGCDTGIIYKVSLNHLGGPTHVFDKSDTERDIEIDRANYYNKKEYINSLSPVDAYNYLMQFIRYEASRIDMKTGSKIRTRWYFDTYNVEKSIEDFMNPELYSHMKQMEFIYWGHESDMDNETYWKYLDEKGDQL